MAHWSAKQSQYLFFLLKFGTSTNAKPGLFIDEIALLRSSAPKCL